MDKLIREYADRLTEIYNSGTAVDGTFTGILASFARQVQVETVAEWRDKLDNETERLAD